MTFEAMKEMYDELSLEKQSEVCSLIVSLYAEDNNTQQKKIGFPFDIFSGGMNYIAEDFDDIPEGFEDYI